jgi:hypothetical protein
LIQQLFIDRFVYFLIQEEPAAKKLMNRKASSEEVDQFIVVNRKIKRVKKLVNCINYLLIHKKLTAMDPERNLLTQTKHFVTELAEMALDKYIQFAEPEPKTLGLLKSLIGMADLMDSLDFFQQEE